MCRPPTVRTFGADNSQMLASELHFVSLTVHLVGYQGAEINITACKTHITVRPAILMLVLRSIYRKK
jgi:hypothetical protein